jgi:hypothetical protein
LLRLTVFVGVESHVCCGSIFFIVRRGVADIFSCVSLFVIVADIFSCASLFVIVADILSCVSLFVIVVDILSCVSVVVVDIVVEDVRSVFCVSVVGTSIFGFVFVFFFVFFEIGDDGDRMWEEEGEGGDIIDLFTSVWDASRGNLGCLVFLVFWFGDSSIIASFVASVSCDNLGDLEDFFVLPFWFAKVFAVVFSSSTGSVLRGNLGALAAFFVLVCSGTTFVGEDLGFFSLTPFVAFVANCLYITP